MTTPSEISEWFDAGVARGATHMVVVCDCFDSEDYPVYVDPSQAAREVAAEYDGKNMQRLMEVYNLAADKQSQIAQWRSFNY